MATYVLICSWPNRPHIKKACHTYKTLSNLLLGNSGLLLDNSGLVLDKLTLVVWANLTRVSSPPNSTPRRFSYISFSYFTFPCINVHRFWFSSRVSSQASLPYSSCHHRTTTTTGLAIFILSSWTTTTTGAANQPLHCCAIAQQFADIFASTWNKICSWSVSFAELLRNIS